jgi:hypothetical protein
MVDKLPSLHSAVHVTYLDAMEWHRPMMHLGRGWIKMRREDWEAAEW